MSYCSLSHLYSRSTFRKEQSFCFPCPSCGRGTNEQGNNLKATCTKRGTGIWGLQISYRINAQPRIIASSMNVKENYIKSIYLLKNFNALWTPKDFYGRAMEFFFFFFLAMKPPFFSPLMKCFIDDEYLPDNETITMYFGKMCENGN